MVDGLGATDMFHIFISADEAHARPNATGTAVPGYVACVMDENGQPLPLGQVGKLAVKGPTGCRYLAMVANVNTSRTAETTPAMRM